MFIDEFRYDRNDTTNVYRILSNGLNRVEHSRLIFIRRKL